jgi:branched-chain amino acid transport system permease protein
MLGQLIVSGLAVGFCYALLALAMVIIYKTSDVLNFAQGEMAMISSFVAFVLLDSYQLPFPLGAGPAQPALPRPQFRDL